MIALWSGLVSGLCVMQEIRPLFKNCLWIREVIWPKKGNDLVRFLDISV